MIAIIDYGVGNLFSLQSSFAAIGQEAVVTSDPEVIAKADRLILPGVGAFEDAAKKLRDSGMADVIKRETAAGKPLMGICLGMQLLLDKSYEYGEHEGLGLIKGNVRPIADVIDKDLKIPHIGWNTLKFNEKSNLFNGIENNSYVYFVHSFAAQTDSKNVSAYTDYGSDVVAAAEHKNVCGTQFHPEKSGEVGLKILKNFCNTVRHDNFTCN